MGAAEGHCGLQEREGEITRSQRGAVAVCLVLFMPVMVLLASLVLDLGNMLFVKQALSCAADMAALAGAQEVDLEKLWAGRRVLREGDAEARAGEAARLNVLWNLSRLPGVSELQVVSRAMNGSDQLAIGDEFDPTVCVELRLPVGLRFFRSGSGKITLRAHAHASVLERRRK